MFHTKGLSVSKFAQLAALLAVFSFSSTLRAIEGEVLWDALELQDVVWPQSLSHPKVVSDGAGGAIVVYAHITDFDYASYSGWIQAVHVDADGTVQWHVRVSSRDMSDYPAVTADGAGGVIVSWMEGRTAIGYTLYAQHLDRSGMRRWGAADVQVSTVFAVGSSKPTLSAPRVVPDNIGGSFVSWDGRLAHVSADGVLDPPGMDGIELVPPGGLTLPFDIISDGGGSFFPTPTPGGVFAAWSDTSGRLVAQWINAGLRWGSGGVQVIRHDAIVTIGLVRDEAGGLLVGWTGTDNSPYRVSVMAARLDNSGTPLWPAPELVVDLSSFGPDGQPSFASDGAGGVIVAWMDGRNAATAFEDLYAQHFDGDGSRRWLTDVLLPPFIVDGTAPGAQGAPRVIPDFQGGALVSYTDAGIGSWDIATTRLNAAGSKLFSRWTFTDSGGISDPGLPQTAPDIDYDGSGPLPTGAVVAWNETEGGHSRLYVDKVKIENTAPENDACEDATPVATNRYDWSLARASRDGSSSCEFPVSHEADTWYRFTAPSAGTLATTTCGTSDQYGYAWDTGMDTVLSLHAACPGTIPNEYVCDDDDAFGIGCDGADNGVLSDSVATLDMMAGQTVLIRVAAYADYTMVGKFINGPLNVSFDAAPDADNDGVADGQDNCIEVANGPLIPDAGGHIQRDSNSDDFGNVCDPDLNDDGRVDFADLALLKKVFFGSDPDADLDGDGKVDFADLAKMKAMFFSSPGPSGLAP